MTILSTEKSTTQPIFFGKDMGITSYIAPTYKPIYRLYERMRSLDWRPQRTVLTKCASDFATFDAHEEHIYTGNIKRQMLLDSLQSRGPVLCLGPVTSASEMMATENEWQSSEDNHAAAYTYILQRVYPNPKAVEQGIYDIAEIVDCAKSVTYYYDLMLKLNAKRLLQTPDYDEYQHKSVLWLLLHAINALEGLRFYVSFVCSWSFAERKQNSRMGGVANIITEICRDENLHLALTQYLIKVLPSNDKDFIKIRDEQADEVDRIILDVANQEKQWATYLFKHGSVLGLTERILHHYVDYLYNTRRAGINLSSKKVSNPLSWADFYIYSGSVQTALQETEATDYSLDDISAGVDEQRVAKWQF